jgi:transcriptional repressor NrdR
MECPYCGSESRVIDSRPIPDGVRRRRVCKVCEKRFTTHERLAPAQLRVAKRNRREPEAFRVEKLIRSLWRVMQGTSLDRGDAERLGRRIELELSEEQLQVVRSGDIARRVLEELDELDELVWERYAVNYREPDGGWSFDREAEESPQLGLFGLEGGEGGERRRGDGEVLMGDEVA